MVRDRPHLQPVRLVDVHMHAVDRPHLPDALARAALAVLAEQGVQVCLDVGLSLRASENAE